MLEFILGLVTAVALAVLPASRGGKMDIDCVGPQDCTPIAGLSTHLEGAAVSNLIIVHGMGGGLETDYTDLSDVFASKLGLIHVESTDEAIPGNPPGAAPARLFVRRYEENTDDPASAQEPDAIGEPKVRNKLNVYELHWWPLGQNRKSRLLADERRYPGKRAFVNRSLKRSLINERLADPILYLSPDLGPAIRDSVSYTLCRAARGTWQAGSCEGVVAMSPTIILTESLGSEIVFSVLTEPGDDDTREAIKQSTTTIFMLANQVPLLRLASAPSTGSATEDALQRFASQWTDARYKQRRQIVAVSDPSDLLSYPIPESITVPGVSFINVTCSLGRRFALGTVVNPLAAHTSAKRDARIIDLIAFGTEYAPHRHQRTPRYRLRGRRAG